MGQETITLSRVEIIMGEKIVGDHMTVHQKGFV
jgi:hypothetical protein